MLDRSVLAHLAVRSSRGPHVTPLAFHRQGNRLWLVAARDSVKTRAVATHPVVGILMGLPDAGGPGAPAVMCAGRARIVDPLTLRGVGTGVLGLPLAACGYLLHNLRPAAAVVRDRPVPTLPVARVLIAVDLTCVALLRGLRVVSVWGAWQRSDLLLRGASLPTEAPPAGSVPAHLRPLLPGLPRPGVLGWQTLSGPMPIPARWEPDGSRLTASAEAMALAGGASSGPCCLTVAAGTRRADPGDGLLLRGEGRARREGQLAHVSLAVRRVTWWTGTRVRTYEVPVPAGGSVPAGPLCAGPGAGNPACRTMP